MTAAAPTGSLTMAGGLAAGAALPGILMMAASADRPGSLMMEDCLSAAGAAQPSSQTSSADKARCLSTADAQLESLTSGPLADDFQMDSLTSVSVQVDNLAAAAGQLDTSQAPEDPVNRSG